MQFEVNSLKKIEKQIFLLQEKQNLSFEQVVFILKKRNESLKQESVPLSIFQNQKLSSLETITKYLKENKKLNYKQIANSLNRNYGSIAVTYRTAKKKFSVELKTTGKKSIPLNIFSDKKLSVLENIVFYLKNKYHMKYSEIADVLCKNQRTIWTVHKRAENKQTK